jgi:hypothetical protein
MIGTTQIKLGTLTLVRVLLDKEILEFWPSASLKMGDEIRFEGT